MIFSPDSLNRKVAKLGLKSVSGKIFTGQLHSVDIVRDRSAAAQEWCEQRFGDEWIWSIPFQQTWTRLYFRTAEDALAFSLAFAGSLAT